MQHIYIHTRVHAHTRKTLTPIAHTHTHTQTHGTSPTALSKMRPKQLTMLDERLVDVKTRPAVVVGQLGNVLKI